MSLFRTLRDERRSISTVDDYALAVQQAVLDQGGGFGFGQAATTWGTQPVEDVPGDFEGFARQLYASNGLVFAVMGVRMLAFSLIRLQWQRMRSGRANDLFGSPELSIFEKPWPGGTTQDLLNRMIQDADLAGNAYIVRRGQRLFRLRPDWVRIIMERVVEGGGTIGWNALGYAYREGGWNGPNDDTTDTAVFLADEVSHFAPTPDPLANFRGMSWLTPILREVTNDKMMGRHKTKFFENAATPNISVSLDKAIGKEAFQSFKEKMDSEHRGTMNAYKTLYVGGGADVKVIGANLQQIDFKNIQGHGETRVAAAGGVPPIIVGLSEGLASGTYSNYGQARRRFADLTMASLWSNAAGTLQPLADPPGRMPSGSGLTDHRLWWDARDVAFLREDRKDAALITQTKAATVAALVNGGFEWESAVAAVEAEDMTLLRHTGLLSVQLQPPGTVAAAPAAAAPAAASGTKSDAAIEAVVARALQAAGVGRVPAREITITNGKG